MTSTERPARPAAPAATRAAAPAATTAPATHDTVRVVGAPARTDLDTGTRAPRSAGTPTAGAPAAPGALAVRLTGAALAAFSAGWAVAFVLLPGAGAGSLLGAGSAVAFQCSLIALLALMWRTAATGARTGRVLLGVAAAVLAVATVQSVSEAVPGAVADTLRVVLDPAWPLSMLAMLVVGITVACAGRWRGAARVWAPVATSWIAILPLMAVVPEAAMGALAAGHILVGYVVLGVVLVARPDLTRR